MPRGCGRGVTLLLTLLALLLAHAAEPHLLPQLGHAGYVNDVAIRPDGRYALTAGFDGTARMWDLEEGALVQVLGQDTPGDPAPVMAVAWTREGFAWCDVMGRVVRVRLDGTQREARQLPGVCLRLEADARGEGLAAVTTEGPAWWPEGGEPQRAVHPVSGTLGLRALAVRGGRLMLAEADGRVSVFSLPELTPLLERDLEMPRLTSAALSPDGRRLVAVEAVGEGGGLAALDLETGALERRPLPDTPLALHWPAEGALTLAVQQARGLTLAPLDRPAEGVTVRLPAAGLGGEPALSDDGRLLVLGETSGGVEVWDLTRAAPARPVFEAPGGRGSRVALSPEGRFAMLRDDGGRVLVRGTEPDAPLCDASPPPGDTARRRLVGVSFTGPAELRAQWSDGEAWLWRLPACERVDAPPLELSELPARSPTDRRSIERWLDVDPESGLGLGGSGGAVALWDLRSGALLRVLRADGLGRALQGRLSPGGAYVVVIGEGGELAFWDARTGALEGRWRAADRGRHDDLALSADGYRVLLDGASRDTTTGEVLADLGLHGGDEAVMMPDGERALVFQLTPELRDLSTGEVLGSLPVPGGVRAVAVAGGWLLLHRGDDRPILLLPLGSRAELRHDLDLNLAEVRGVDLSEDGTALLVSRKDGWLRRWDLARAAPSDAARLPVRELGAAALLPGDEALVAAWQLDGTEAILRVDLTRGEVLEVHEAAPCVGWPLVADPRGGRYARLAMGSPEEAARQQAHLELRSAEGGALLGEWSVPYATALRWEADGRVRAPGVYGDFVLDPDTGESSAPAVGAPPKGLPDRTPRDASADGRLEAQATPDGRVRLRVTDSGEALTLLASGPDWLIAADDGVFDASRGGGHLLAVSDGQRALPIDRYAATHNRPDLLLERLGTGPEPLVQHLRDVALERQRVMGLDHPSLELAPGPALRVDGARVEGSEAVLPWSAEPLGAPLRALHLRADGVPVYGAAGLPLAEDEREGELRLPLLPGVNRLQLSVVDAAGVSSPERRVSLEGPPADPGRLFVFTFGVSRYRDPRLRLGWAAQDAQDLAARLQGAQGYAEVVTRSWTDDEVTAAALEELAALLAATEPRDSVVLFFAGHGTWTSGDPARYVYLPADASARRLDETGVPFEALEALFDGIPARRRLLLLDTCESGKRDPGGLRFAWPAELDARGARALVLDTEEVERVELLDETRRARSRYIYNDTARRAGAVVFSSSRGDEQSYERDDLQNGVFTEVLLQALEPRAADANRDGQVDFEELQRFVTEGVSAQTLGKQTPSVDWDNPEGRIVLPVVE